MSKIIGVTFFSLFFAILNGHAQSIVGTYDTHNSTHTNPHHFEQIILHSDSTFIYSTQMEFIKIEKVGNWSISGDSLVLSEANSCCHTKMTVTEVENKNLKEGQVRFNVATLQDELITYHLILSGATGIDTLWAMQGAILVDMKKIKNFQFMIGSLTHSPLYTVKSKRSNEFIVRLAPRRLFIKEKWILHQDALTPLGWDNQYVNYKLTKVP